MISTALIRQAKALLRQKLPRSEVAAQTGISKGTVHRIAHGLMPAKRPGRAKRSNLSPGEKRCLKHRCPDCRGMITVLPCRFCARAK